jgi:hypothetical protein
MHINMKIIKDKMMNKYILYFVLCIFSFTTSSYSQTPDIQLKVPYLGNHKFMPNTFVKDPFIKTYIRNTLGVGQALDVNIPVVEIDGVTLVAFQGDLLYVNLDFEYHQAVKDWLGVWGRFKVLGRLGNDTQALVAQGITAASGFDFGWLFKLHQTERSQLSGSLSLSNTSTTVVNLLNFIDGIIDGDYSPNNQLVRNIPALRGNSGLHYAWAMNDFFGTYLLGELSYGQSVVERNEGKFFYRLGGVLDFDLSARTVFPFGVLVGASYSSLPRTGDNTNKNAQILFLRIGYNSQSDFSIGIESSVEFVPLESTDETLKAGLTTINMRYYFN